MIKQLKKYLLMLCLSYMLIGLLIKFMALYNGITEISISALLWIFILSFTCVVIMYFFDKIQFSNLIFEVTVRSLSIYAVVFGLGAFVLGILYNPNIIIALLIALPIIIVSMYFLLYDKERRDAKQINEKLKKMDCETEESA
jgi:L-asparagine transporter-like permease